MNRWLNLIWVGALTILVGSWTAPAHGQCSKKGGGPGGKGQMSGSSGQSSGTMQTPFARGNGMQNPYAQNSGMQNPFAQSSGMTNPFNPGAGMQNPYAQTSAMQSPYGQNYGMQQMTPAQLTAMMQILTTQMNAIQQQQTSQSPRSQGYALDNPFAQSQTGYLGEYVMQTASPTVTTSTLRRLAAR
jgi:hypothetical protein